MEVMEKSKEKHRRGANYTEEEKEFFLHVIRRYSNIIDNKRTDSETIKQKKEAWKEITLIYNQVAKTGLRDWEQLRNLYDNIKRKKKKSLSEGNNAKPAEEINYIEIIKEEILPIDETISGEKQIIPAEGEVMFVAEQMVSNEEQGLSNEEQTRSVGDHILPAETKVIPIEGQSISNEELILPKQEQFAPNQERLKSNTTYENVISMRCPELKLLTRSAYLHHRRQLFKKTMSTEDLKMIYLRKKIQNANLKRQILIAEHKMQMKIFKTQLKKLKE
ncbi:hypothetical protein ILUMI_00342 [Ignelater luminosus]|uniref:Regulatory protein zeste n=1 Tax=Ignelater luminosus TaxID=2038154 RepID=A0A8K0GN72_IGNLU|nr:hypothetical protein ILUMI_00342 [Ignelater luminosus]